MRIFNQNKTKELNVNVNDIDFSKGHLIDDSIITHIPEQQEIVEQFHYETVREYPNGGKDVEKVIDVEGKPYIAEHDETENIQVYIPYTEQELERIELDNLRSQRETECFPIINRGKLWYDNLTEQQLQELNEWYHAWLDVTDTKVIPEKPEWLN